MTGADDRHSSGRCVEPGRCMQALASAMLVLLLLGSASDCCLAKGTPDPPAKNPQYADVETLALSQRLDVESARRELDVAGQAAGITNITRFINVREIGVAREKETGALTKRGPVLGVELPIFDWGSASMARQYTSLQLAAGVPKLYELS